MSGSTSVEYPLHPEAAEKFGLPYKSEASDSSDSTSDSSSTVSQSESTCSIDSMSGDESMMSHGRMSNDGKCVIIFDWDDTLLPSSWLTAEGLRLDSPVTIPSASIAELEVLESACIFLLERAVNYGDVIIITNAEAGWVELSARRFFPRVLPLLKRLGIQVLSARSTFESDLPENPFAWKLAAFDQEIGLWARRASSSLKHGEMLHVVSFGDSVHERDAVHQIAGQISFAHTKSIKFVERPNTEQLRRQVELVHSCFDYISNYDGDLDLMLTIQLLYNN